MTVDELLEEFRDIKFMVAEESFGLLFDNKRVALERAKTGRLTLDCANFASLLAGLVFEPTYYNGDYPFRIKPGFVCVLPETTQHVRLIAPVERRGHDLPLSSHGQWLVKPYADDDRLLGLTLTGVEAHTLEEWLAKHSSMIDEALQNYGDCSGAVEEAAFYSGDWIAMRVVSLSERPPKNTQYHELWSFDRDDWEGTWRVLRPPTRKRVRTRLFVRKEIEKRRSVGMLEKLIEQSKHNK